MSEKEYGFFIALAVVCLLTSIWMIYELTHAPIIGDKKSEVEQEEEQDDENIH